MSFLDSGRLVPIRTLLARLGASLPPLRSNWLVVLSLSLGVAAVTARLAWSFLPRPAGTYQASALLRVEGPRPALALVRSRPVLLAALRQPASAELEAVQQHPEEVLRRLEKDLHASWDDAQVLRLSLAGSQPATVVTLVNAVKDAYVREVVDRDRLERQARLEVLDRQYQDLQKELSRKRNELPPAAAATEAEQQAVQRYEELNRELNRAEKELMQEHLRDTLQRKDKGATLPPAAPEALVEEAIEKDPEIQTIVKKAEALLDYIHRVEQIAVRPAALEEYRDAVSQYNALVKDKDSRRAALRQRIERQLREQEQADEVAALDKTRQAVAFLAAEHRRLTEMVAHQLDEVNRQRTERQQNQGQQLAVQGQQQFEVARLEAQSQKVQAEMAAVRTEMQALPRAVSLQNAEEAERQSVPGTGGPLLAAALLGLLAFLATAGTVAWIGGRHSPLVLPLRPASDATRLAA